MPEPAKAFDRKGPVVLLAFLVGGLAAVLLNVFIVQEKPGSAKPKAATPPPSPVEEASAPQPQATVVPAPAFGDVAISSPPPLPPAPPPDRVPPRLPAQAAPNPPAGAEGDVVSRASLAKELEDRAGPPMRDLEIVMGLFQQYLAQFTAYPSGDNRQMTNALTGNNPAAEVFLPRGHPTINAAGEITDRWGTPLFFHMIARDQLEIRSAGPDRELYTADDFLEKSPTLRNPKPETQMEL